jgi:IS30 family transposase
VVRGKELSFEEREEVSRHISGGLSIRETGRRLGRDASVVSREITRNGGRAAYRALAGAGAC